MRLTAEFPWPSWPCIARVTPTSAHWGRIYQARVQLSCALLGAQVGSILQKGGPPTRWLQKDMAALANVAKNE